MNRNFDRSLSLVLKHEGGYVDHPRDPGGATNKGITIATFRRYVNSKGTTDDLKRLTTAQAGIVYRKQYWNAIKGDDLPDGVDYAVFDFAVNSGPSRAAKYLQAVLGVAQDGRIGPATIASAKAKSAAAIINALCDARMAFLNRLPTWGTFGKGWTRRVKGVRAEALAMTRAAPPAPAKPVLIPDKPSIVVVSQKGNEPATITVRPAPAESTTPTVPKSKTGWALLAAILAAIAAVFAKYFGG